MNSRERVEKALNHEPTDRIPIDFGGSPVTGIAASVVYKLREEMGLGKPGDSLKVIEPYQMLGEIADDLKAKFWVDCIWLPGRKNMFGFENAGWKEWKLFDGTPVLVPELFNTAPEEDGSILMYAQGDKSCPPCAVMPKDGFYFDSIPREEPIDEKNLRVEDNLEEFHVFTDDELEHFRREADNLYKNTDFAILGDFGGTAFGDISFVPGPSLKHPKGIRGIEEWYMSLATRREFLFEIFEKQCEIGLQNLKLVHEAVQDKISVVFVTGTDFGTQRGQFISTDLYRELFKPFHRKINDWVHDNTKWKTFMHSCGSVVNLIEEFIDAGIDILNPVQCSAAGMQSGILKEKFGKKITFWGGGVDTQKTLPFGTPEEVKKEVAERCRIFGEGGGFVFNTIHNIQPGTPIENVLAMIEALHGYNETAEQGKQEVE